MATLRAASRLRPSGWLAGFTCGRRKLQPQVFPATKYSPAFHLFPKNVVTSRFGVTVSSYRACSSSTVKDVAAAEAPPPHTPPPSSSSTSESDVFDDFLHSNMMTKSLDMWTEMASGVTSTDATPTTSSSTQRDQLGQIIADKSFADVVAYSLTPASPPENRSSCLKILLTQDKDVGPMETLLRRTVEDVMALPMKVVANMVFALSTAAKTPLRESVRKELVLAVVNRRWYDVGPNHVVFFLYQLDELFDMKKLVADQRQHRGKTAAAKKRGAAAAEAPKLSVPLASNMESRTVSLADQLKVKDLSRVILLLGKWRSRNEPLLNAMLHRLSQDDLSNYTYTQLTNVLYACSILRLHHTDFMHNLSSQLRQSQPPNTKMACAMLSSLSFLRWRDPALVHATLDFLADKAHRLTTREAGNVINSLANLYPVPLEEKHAQLVIDLSNKVSGVFPREQDTISYMYSVAVLLLMSGHLVTSALTPEVTARLLTSDLLASQPALVHRLCAVNMAAKTEVKDFTGSLLSDQDLETLAKIPQQKDKGQHKLTESLLKALSKFTNLSTYVRSGQELPQGLNADCIMCCNSSGDVRPLAGLDDTDNAEALHRLAVQVIPYSSVLNPDQTPVGSCQFNARLLHHCGYIPVQILYSDIRSSHSPAENVNRIKQRISSAVREYGGQSHSTQPT